MPPEFKVMGTCRMRSKQRSADLCTQLTDTIDVIMQHKSLFTRTSKRAFCVFTVVGANVRISITLVDICARVKGQGSGSGWITVIMQVYKDYVVDSQVCVWALVEFCVRV